MLMNDGSPKATSLQFEYIKSNFFRVIHADGAWGGLTPQVKIQISFYSERTPIPNTIVQELGGDGALGKEIRRESKVGIIREVESSVVMDVAVAQELVRWLQEKIDQAEAVLKEQSDEP
jgi:hypothetical protein